MRRSVVAAALAAALVLAAPALAAASPMGHRVGPPKKEAPAAAARASHGAWLRIAPRFVPAQEAIGLDTLATIAGTVLRYDGTPLAGADVAWWIDSGDYPEGEGSTDALGKYQFDGIPAADGDGTVRVDAADGSLSMAWWDRTWTVAGPNAFDLQPGGIQVEAENGGPWGRRTSGMFVDSISVTEGDGGGWAAATLPRLSGMAPAFPGTLIVGDVYFHADEGVEMTGVEGTQVEAGVTSPGVISVKQSRAQRVWTGVGNAALTGPWGSGRPGSKLKLWLQNYPAGWMNQILGWSLDGDMCAFKVYGDPTATGASKYALELQVPAEATPGYGYNLNVMHVNGGALTLDTWFQVCTLKADKTAISRGQLVHFNGVIPVQGHEGDAVGKSSRLYFWGHDGKVTQPTTVSTRSLKAQGWKYVGYVRTDGHGRYKTPAVRPGKTSTFVAFYPGDGWYYPAFTSPLRITVK